MWTMNVRDSPPEVMLSWLSPAFSVPGQVDPASAADVPLEVPELEPDEPCPELEPALPELLLDPPELLPAPEPDPELEPGPTPELEPRPELDPPEPELAPCPPLDPELWPELDPEPLPELDPEFEPPSLVLSDVDEHATTATTAGKKKESKGRERALMTGTFPLG
jgi:hypothetical protein